MTTRNYILFRPKYRDRKTGEPRQSPNWSVKFHHRGRQILKTTETPHKREAARRAKALVEAAEAEGWDALKRRLPGADVPTVARVVDLYREYAPQARNRKGRLRALARRTVEQNVACLVRFAAMTGAKTVADLAGRVPRYLAHADIRSLSDQTKAKHIRSVASVFTPPAIAYYAACGCAVVNPLAGQGVDAGRLPEKFYDVAMVRDLLEAARVELRGARPAEYALFLLAIGAGLRTVEACNLVKADLMDDVVRVRAIWAKNRREQLTPIHPDVVRELRSIGGASPHVVPPRKQYRDDLPGPGRGRTTKRELGQWLRAHGVGSDKPVHYLRGLLGALIATRHGLYAAQKVLRHSSPAVTDAHYAALLERPTTNPLDGGSWGSQGV